MRRVLLSICVVVVGTACGGEPKPDAVATYRALAGEISAAVEVHRATSQWVAPEHCPSEASRYGSEVGPKLERMSWMSAEIEACIGGVSAGCAFMRQELEDHLAGACAGPDIAAEATRHASVMQGRIDDALRATSMAGTMMGSGGHCAR